MLLVESLFNELYFVGKVPPTKVSLVTVDDFMLVLWGLFFGLCVCVCFWFLPLGPIFPLRQLFQIVHCSASDLFFLSLLSPAILDLMRSHNSRWWHRRFGKRGATVKEGDHGNFGNQCSKKCGHISGCTTAQQHFQMHSDVVITLCPEIPSYAKA